MTFEDGVTHMKNLCAQIQNGENKYFDVNILRINYPGYKKNGDYRLSINGKAPKHTDIVDFFYNNTDGTNHDVIVEALNDLYVNGLQSQCSLFTQTTKELVYWITLQEEINYPQTRGYAGRKLPFQRFYEGVLAKLGHINLTEVYNRTNNHGKGKPVLLNIQGLTPPVFYR